MAGIARWCFRHRFVVLLAWIAGLIALGAAGNALGTDYANSFSLPGTESTKALTLLQSHDAAQSGGEDTIVWRTASGSARSAQVQAGVTTALDRLAKLPEVASVRSPYDASGGV